MPPSFFSSKKKRSTPGPVHKLFTRHDHNFKFHRHPTITVSAPSCGPSTQPGNLDSLTEADSPAELFPTLTWHFDSSEEKEELHTQQLKKIKEYLLIVEDLDGGTFGSHPQAIGIYYVIPASTTTISASDLVKSRKGKLERLLVAERGLVGGFKYADLDGKVWRTPKAGHRIHFQVVALARTVDGGQLSEFPTIRSFYGKAEGAVLGWGEWVGIYGGK